MTAPTGIGIAEYLRALADPRIERTKHHLVIDIVTIAICALIRGANDRVQVAAFGRGKLKWLQHFLALPHGIPSHDTFWRGLRALAPLKPQLPYRY